MEATRQSRKLDHVRCALQLQDGPGISGFQDIQLIHHCLPGLALEEIDLSTAVAGQALSQPLIINALTGGAGDVAAINEGLAILARETQSVLAVGSQYAALENKALTETYRLVRRHNPRGLVWANLGAYATPVQAAAAVEMVEAQALQLHLNTAQELFMAEGDRDFRGYQENIAAICQRLPVPVIVKEVGCGISREAAALLWECGVAALDVSGAGGTNFIAIEALRTQEELAADLLSWGIPTACALLEAGNVAGRQHGLIASGGVRTALDVVKALALGANAVAMAAPALRLVCNGPLEAAVAAWEELLQQVRRLMLLSGSRNLAALRTAPLIMRGLVEDWRRQRALQRRRSC